MPASTQSAALADSDDHMEGVENTALPESDNGVCAIVDDAPVEEAATDEEHDLIAEEL